VAISFSTGTTANSGNSQNASQAITIDPGAGVGHTCLFVACVVPLNTNPVTMTASSTGTTPTQIGPTQQVVLPAPGTVNASLWKVTCTASDPSAVVTFGIAEGGQAGFWAVALGIWTETGGAPVIDVSGGAAAAAGAATATCPVKSTGAAGDWAIYLTAGTYQVSGLTGSPASTSQRELVTSSVAVVAGIFDSNASVGGAGTSIGGGAFTTGGANANNGLTAFTVGLAPPSSGFTSSGGLALAGMGLGGQALSGNLVSGGLAMAGRGMAGQAAAISIAGSGGLAMAGMRLAGVASNGQAAGVALPRLVPDDARHRMRRRLRRQWGGLG
jgi:hypothetical protein